MNRVSPIVRPQIGRGRADDAVVSQPHGPPRAETLASVSFAAAALLCCAGSAVLAARFVFGLGGLLRNP